MVKERERERKGGGGGEEKKDSILNDGVDAYFTGDPFFGTPVLLFLTLLAFNVVA